MQSAKFVEVASVDVCSSLTREELAEVRPKNLAKCRDLLGSILSK
jgi:hypothetical protein